MVRVADRAHSVVMLVSPLVANDSETETRLKSRPLSKIRDAMGAMVAQLEKLELDCVEVDFDLNAEELKAALTGLEIAIYRFKNVRQGQPSKLKMQLLVFVI